MSPCPPPYVHLRHRRRCGQLGHARAYSGRRNRAPTTCPACKEVVLTGGDRLRRRRRGLVRARAEDVASEQVLGVAVDAARRGCRQSATLRRRLGEGRRRRCGSCAARAEAVLAAVRAALADRARCPFAFAEARIITGDEEALFGWRTRSTGFSGCCRGRSRRRPRSAGSISAARARRSRTGCPKRRRRATGRARGRWRCRTGRRASSDRSPSLGARRPRRSCASSPPRRTSRARAPRRRRRAGAEDAARAPVPRRRRRVHARPRARPRSTSGRGTSRGCEALVGRLNHADEECPPGFCGRRAVPFSAPFYGVRQLLVHGVAPGDRGDDGARVLSVPTTAPRREACARPWSWHKNQFAGAELGVRRSTANSGSTLRACAGEHKHGDRALRPRRHDRAPPTARSSTGRAGRCCTRSRSGRRAPCLLGAAIQTSKAATRAAS